MNKYTTPSFEKTTYSDDDCLVKSNPTVKNDVDNFIIENIDSWENGDNLFSDDTLI